MRQAAPGRARLRQAGKPPTQIPMPQAATSLHKPGFPDQIMAQKNCNPDLGLRTRFSNSFGIICKMVHPFELKIVSSILTFDGGAL